MKILAFILICLLLFACTETKQVTNFKEIAAKHKTIALLPASASFILTTKQKSKISQSQIEESELKLGFMVQTELNKWFEKNKKNYTISVQDIKITNELLFAKGMNFKEFLKVSKDSLAKILNVDAVIFCDVELANKFSNTEYDVLLAYGAPVTIFGIFMGSKYDVKVKFGIVEKENLVTLWQKNYMPTGKIDEDIFGILRRMLKTAAVDFPYKK
jgi:hypothetical protein